MPKNINKWVLIRHQLNHDFLRLVQRNKRFFQIRSIQGRHGYWTHQLRHGGNGFVLRTECFYGAWHQTSKEIIGPAWIRITAPSFSQGQLCTWGAGLALFWASRNDLFPILHNLLRELSLGQYNPQNYWRVDLDVRKPRRVLWCETSDRGLQAVVGNCVE